MRWFKPNTPFWLPEGTVTAAIVIIITLTNMAILLKFAAYKEEMPSTVAKIMDGSLMANIMLIQNYVHERKEQKLRSNNEA